MYKRQAEEASYSGVPSSVRLNAAPVVSMTRYIVSPRSGTTEHTARYCNSGGTVSLPDAPDALSGQAFDGWFDGDTEFTEATVISSDMTLNARFSNILVSSIRLSSASLTLQVGSTHTLTATVEPEDAANKGITWSSSDTSVATVGDNGLVTEMCIRDSLPDGWRSLELRFRHHGKRYTASITHDGAEIKERV